MSDIVACDDWDKRMDEYRHTPEQRSVLAAALAKTAEWFRVRDETQWTLQEDAKKEGVMIYAVRSERGQNLFKGSGIVDAPAWVCLEVMTARPLRRKYDVNIEESYLIDRPAVNVWHAYQRSKKIGVWPVCIEPRDFVMTTHVSHVSSRAQWKNFITVLCLFSSTRTAQSLLSCTQMKRSRHSYQQLSPHPSAVDAT